MPTPLTSTHQLCGLQMFKPPQPRRRQYQAIRGTVTYDNHTVRSTRRDERTRDGEGGYGRPQWRCTGRTGGRNGNGIDKRGVPGRPSRQEAANGGPRFPWRVLQLRQPQPCRQGMPMLRDVRVAHQCSRCWLWRAQSSVRCFLTGKPPRAPRPPLPPILRSPLLSAPLPLHAATACTIAGALVTPVTSNIVVTTPVLVVGIFLVSLNLRCTGQQAVAPQGSLSYDSGLYSLIESCESSTRRQARSRSRKVCFNVFTSMRRLCL